jgi:hypothetical protein
MLEAAAGREYRTERKDAAFFCEWQVAVEALKERLEDQSDDSKRRAGEALERGENLLQVAQR